METYLLITDRKSNTNIWTMLTHYQINIRARVIGVSIQHHTVTPHLYNFRTWPCVVEYMFSKWNVKIFRYLATRAEFFPFFFFFFQILIPSNQIDFNIESPWYIHLRNDLASTDAVVQISLTSRFIRNNRSHERV